jgi:hypothetical protein
MAAEQRFLQNHEKPPRIVICKICGGMAGRIRTETVPKAKIDILIKLTRSM